MESSRTGFTLAGFTRPVRVGNCGIGVSAGNIRRTDHACKQSVPDQRRIHTAGRHDDTCGIGAGNMTFSTEGPRGEDEMMIELFYKVRLGSNIILQPDLQYIASPGGMYTDSFVAGLRFQTIL